MKKLIFVALVALQLLGCAGTKPDLKRLYSVSSADYFQNPVIVIHGAFGSKLRTNEKKEIWPGNYIDMLFGRYAAVALDIDPKTLEPVTRNVEAYALFDRAGQRDYYGQILKALREAGGYARGRPGNSNSGGSRRYYVFLYDWRQDLVKSAVELDRLIEQIRRDYRRPALKVDIVAHSMGALLTRYYVRYGSEDVLDLNAFRPNQHGAAKIRKAVLIGAPNLGSISGLQFFMKGFKVGFNTIPPEVIATMPSAYQILPHPDRDWMITPEGRKLSRDLYSIRTWRDFQWSIFDPRIRARISRRFADKAEAQRYLRVLERYFEKWFKRAKHFHHALSVPLKNPTIRYVVFGGDCELTPARCLVETVDGKTMVRLHPKEIVNRIPGVDYHKLMLEPGDGRVTKPSLLARNALDPSIPGNDRDAFPLAYSVFLCERHSQLTGNISFQDNLLNILLLQETTEDRMSRIPQ